MHLGTVNGCANRIALSIQRKFLTAVKLSFLMRHVWPWTPDRLWSIAKLPAYPGGIRLSATPSLSIDFLIPKKRRLPRQMRIHIL